MKSPKMTLWKAWGKFWKGSYAKVGRTIPHSIDLCTLTILVKTIFNYGQLVIRMSIGYPRMYKYWDSKYIYIAFKPYMGAY